MMPEESSACQSCAGVLSNVNLFDQLRSQEGLNISQTAGQFFAAVEHGCAICTAINKKWRDRLGSMTSKPFNKQFRIRNGDVPRRDSQDLDIWEIKVVAHSPINHWPCIVEFETFTEAGKAISVSGSLTPLTQRKMTRPHDTLLPVQSIWMLTLKPPLHLRGTG